MKLSDFDYMLPEGLIAQYPAERRSDSRLMCVDRTDGSISHQDQFSEIVQSLKSGDVLVRNNTKVIPARLYGHKATGGKVELLVERILDEQRVLCHLKASHVPKIGAKCVFGPSVQATLLNRHDTLFEVAFALEDDEHVLSFIEQNGEVPLPPYITHAPDADDEARYQTVYAQVPGAVAAPTAGLHFTPELLGEIQRMGVTIVDVTLHVGAGTFQPVRVEKIDEHHMHSEWMEISKSACDQINAARSVGGRILAIGTTSVRTLESAYEAGQLIPCRKETSLFIKPGYSYQVVDMLLTNFHLPKSSLIMLVAAFAGHELTMRAYAQAVAKQYRFFSYGDAMLIVGKPRSG